VLSFDDVEPRQWGDPPGLVVHRFIGRGYTALATYLRGTLVLQMGKTDGDKVLFCNGRISWDGLADRLRSAASLRFGGGLAWIDWDRQAQLFQSRMSPDAKATAVTP
jgi:hypothetical protein